MDISTRRIKEMKKKAQLINLIVNSLVAILSILRRYVELVRIFGYVRRLCAMTSGECLSCLTCFSSLNVYLLCFNSFRVCMLI